MKKILLLLMFLTGIVNATTYGAPVFKVCPKCISVTKVPVLTSGNTFGARHWTDGKMEARMLPRNHWLVKCPECKALLWVDELKKLRRKDVKANVPKDKLYSKFLTANIKDYYKELDTYSLDDKKVRYIRIQIWRMENDKRRDNNKTIAITAAEQDNLTVLFDLLPSNADYCIMRAEIQRELGNYDEAERILNQVTEEEKSSKVVLQIMELIKQKNPYVDEIELKSEI